MKNQVQPSHWVKLTMLTVALASAYVLGSTPPLADVTEVEFRVYEREGKPVRWGSFRQTQENGKGTEGHNDKLLDPQDLTVLIKRKDNDGDEAYGLFSSKEGDAANNGDPVIEWPRDRKVAVTLSMAWPTSEGYSNLLLDLPYPAASPAPTYPSSRLPIYTRAGEKRFAVNFNLLAAQQMFGNLETMLAERARPPFSFTYTPSPSYREAYTSAYNAAAENLRAAKGTDLGEEARGSFGQKAFEAASTATLLMLEDYGVQYARARRAVFRPQWGVTFEWDKDTDGKTAPVNEYALKSVRQLVNCVPGDGWVRIIISDDKERSPEYYRPAIRLAHKYNLKVLGELLDSEAMCCIDSDRWKAHVEKYVRPLSDNPEDRDAEVDAWEVGNEVNGEWLVEKDDEKEESQEGCRRCTGYAGKADFIAYAAEYVKRKTSKRTVLTLYWQVGEHEADFAMFNWLREKLDKAKTSDRKSVMTVIDDVGISLYPDKAPMGTAFDRVLRTLRGRYFTQPAQRILITELDYYPTKAEEDYKHTWRWGAFDLKGDSPPVEFQRARARVAKLYQSAILGYPYSGGGTYWWYYLQEVAPDEGYAGNDIWRTLNYVNSSVVADDERCPRPDH